MKTPSHAAIGWLMSRHSWWPAHLPAAAVVAGSVAPDMPIAIAFTWIGTGKLVSGEGEAILAAFRAAYESDPVLVASHQLLHAPFSLAVLYATVLVVGALNRGFGCWLRSFLYGAMAHSLVDIFTHVDDGPLLFWPIEATVRFASPISHWDASHCAALCVFVEVVVCLLAIHRALLEHQNGHSSFTSGLSS